MKKLMIMCLALFLAGSAFAQEGEELSVPNVGLSFAIDYYSMYLWRGTKFFDGDGAVCPSIAWEPFQTGLVLTVAAEISQDFLFDGFRKKPGKHYGVLPKGGLKINHWAYASQSIDAGLDYSYTIKEAVTIGAGLWYWWYYNSRHAREFARIQSESANTVSRVDISFLTAALSVGLDIVPYINPTLSVTYDYYTAIKKGGDFYAQLGFSHDFELAKEVSLGLGISAGYYYFRTGESTYYYESGGSLARSRTPLIKGFSDITPSVSLSFEKNGLSLSAGFFWVIVPAKSWYKGDDNHRYYAKLGIGYSI